MNSKVSRPITPSLCPGLVTSPSLAGKEVMWASTPIPGSRDFCNLWVSCTFKTVHPSCHKKTSALPSLTGTAWPLITSITCIFWGTETYTVLASERLLFTRTQTPVVNSPCCCKQSSFWRGLRQKAKTSLDPSSGTNGSNEPFTSSGSVFLSAIALR